MTETSPESRRETKNEIKPKKDWWDRLGVILGAAITLVGVSATIVYNQQQTKLKEIEIVRGLFQHLLSENEREYRLAVFAVGHLANRTLATELAAAIAPGSKSATAVAGFGPQEVQKLYQEGKPAVRETARAALDKLSASTETPGARASEQIVSVAPSHSSAPGVPTQAGWIYLGDYSNSEKAWRTRYLQFSQDAEPESLKSQTLIVRDETGALNVRVGMPTPEAEFPRVIATLKPGSQVTVRDVKPWQSTGLTWAQISYIRR